MQEIISKDQTSITHMNTKRETKLGTIKMKLIKFFIKFDQNKIEKIDIFLKTYKNYQFDTCTSTCKDCKFEFKRIRRGFGNIILVYMDVNFFNNTFNNAIFFGKYLKNMSFKELKFNEFQILSNSIKNTVIKDNFFFNFIFFFGKKIKHGHNVTKLFNLMYSNLEQVKSITENKYMFQNENMLNLIKNTKIKQLKKNIIIFNKVTVEKFKLSKKKIKKIFENYKNLFDVFFIVQNIAGDSIILNNFFNKAKYKKEFKSLEDHRVQIKQIYDREFIFIRYRVETMENMLKDHFETIFYHLIIRNIVTRFFKKLINKTSGICKILQSKEEINQVIQDSSKKTSIKFIKFNELSNILNHLHVSKLDKKSITKGNLFLKKLIKYKIPSFIFKNNNSNLKNEFRNLILMKRNEDQCFFQKKASKYKKNKKLEILKKIRFNNYPKVPNELKQQEENILWKSEKNEKNIVKLFNPKLKENVKLFYSIYQKYLTKIKQNCLSEYILKNNKLINETKNEEFTNHFKMYKFQKEKHYQINKTKMVFSNQIILNLIIRKKKHFYGTLFQNVKVMFSQLIRNKMDQFIFYLIKEKNLEKK